MVDPMLMRGDGWLRCCICGEMHEKPFATLALDIDGDRWDLCKGDCAEKAGVVEAPRDWWDERRACLRCGSEFCVPVGQTLITESTMDVAHVVIWGVPLGTTRLDFTNPDDSPSLLHECRRAMA